jgi:Na+/H+ antiporter NhaC
MEEFTNAGILSVVPPLVAIVLALITKEVIFSLLVGIMSGALICSFMPGGLGLLGIFTVSIETMGEKLGDNATMVIFLALLGGLVALVTKAGGSKAYGAWAKQKIKTQKGAGFVTALLGIIIFIDDYFNCLTVGTVMRPITDPHKISREKLAYIIDATAAPICIIAPISSWAASVISYYPESDGMSGMAAFLSSVPMNLYAILTIFMVFWLVLRKNSDYGPMAIAQRRADEKGIVESASTTGNDELDNIAISSNGKIIDLILPVLVLIFVCILTMLYYGGYWGEDSISLFEAFGDTDATIALALGGLITLVLTFAFYIARKTLTFKEFFDAVGLGIKSMVPPIIILTLAWTLAGICRDVLHTGEFVAGVVESSNMPVIFIPAVMFIIAALISFATGTSWGTFGILIPIGLAITEIVAPHLSITTLSSVLAGSVFGDHCSPISDTTILSSTGSRCNHIDHVATQLPYSVTVAAVCFIGYLIAGFSSSLGFATSLIITLPICFALLIGALLVLPKMWKTA